MERPITIKTPNSTTLVYLFQNGYGWGRGKTIKSAKEAFKKSGNGKIKGKSFVSTYAVRKGVSADEGLKGISCDAMSQIYSTENAILLGTTEL